MYSSKPRNPVPVYLNVYDLGNSNSWLHGMGLGAYHTGLEVYGREYSFGHQNNGGSGVFESAPRSADGCVFREQVQLGSVLMSMSDVNSAVSKLKPQFKANEYHILTRNCNSFSDALSQALLGHGIPAWVNRLASVGQCCSCFLPPEMQPKNQRSGSNAGDTDKLLGKDGRGDGFVAFQGSGHSLSGSGGADTKTPASASSKSASSGNTTGGGAAAAAGGGVGADEKREKMRRAALDRLTKAKQSDAGAAGGGAAPVNAI